jgi:hypothetical protein
METGKTKITMASLYENILSLQERLVTAESQLSTLLAGQKAPVASPRPQKREVLTREQRQDRDIQRAFKTIEDVIGVDVVVDGDPKELSNYEKDGTVYTFKHRVNAIDGLGAIITAALKGKSRSSKPAVIMATAAALRNPKVRELLPVIEEGDDTSLVMPISG